MYVTEADRVTATSYEYLDLTCIPQIRLCLL